MRILILAIALTALAPLTPVHAATPHMVTIFSNGYRDSDTGQGVTNVAVGTTVTWAWENGAHSVTQGVSGATPTDPLGGASSGTRSAGLAAPYSITFGTAGDFVYYCSVHAAMRGIVHVA